MPACARRELVREGEVGIYHCVNRCVRRAFLCGEDQLTGRSFEHRREWIRARLELLSGSFAIEICGFAVMSNHIHVIVRLRPDLAAYWDKEELARRWWRRSPRHQRDDPEPSDIRKVLEARGGGEGRIQELRSRLSGPGGAHLEDEMPEMPRCQTRDADGDATEMRDARHPPSASLPEDEMRRDARHPPSASLPAERDAKDARKMPDTRKMPKDARHPPSACP